MANLRKTPNVTTVPEVVAQAFRPASHTCYSFPPSGTIGDGYTPPPPVPPGAIVPAAGTPILLETPNGVGGYDSTESVAPAPGGYVCRNRVVHVYTPGQLTPATTYYVVCTLE